MVWREARCCPIPPRRKIPGRLPLQRARLPVAFCLATTPMVPLTTPPVNESDWPLYPLALLYPLSMRFCRSTVNLAAACEIHANPWALRLWISGYVEGIPRTRTRLPITYIKHINPL